MAFSEGKALSAVPVGLHMQMWWKYLRSFLSSAWHLSDYPIEVSKEFVVDVGEQWAAHVIGSHLFGFGDSQEAAWAELQTRFDAYKKENGTAPRPGTHWPLEMESSKEIERHEAIAREFFPKVLGMDFDACVVVSDESSLWDFDVNGESGESYLERVRTEYGLDVSDIEDGNLVAIFERIARKGAAQDCGGQSTE